MSAESPNPNDAIQVLSQAYRYPGRYPMTAPVLIGVMFTLLDAMPEARKVTEIQLESRAGKDMCVSACKALSLAKCVEIEGRSTGRGGAKPLWATGTDRLVTVGQGFNQVYLGLVAKHVASIPRKEIIVRSTRQLAESHGIKPKPSAGDNIDMLVESTGMHSITVAYRALMSFACGRHNVLPGVEKDAYDLVRGNVRLENVLLPQFLRPDPTRSRP